MQKSGFSITQINSSKQYIFTEALRRYAPTIAEFHRKLQEYLEEIIAQKKGK